MKKHGLPDSIRVGGQVYQVRHDDDMAAEDGRYGLCNTRQLLIEIDGGSAPTRQHQTLIHEALEAINCEYHAQLSHDQIEQLEGALFALLRDNPGVFA